MFLIGELRESINQLNEESGADRDIITLKSDDDELLQAEANKNQVDLIDNVQQLGFFEKMKAKGLKKKTI